MKIIAGLGNPGAQYENTPHSAGFEAVDMIAAQAGVSWSEKRAFKAMTAKCVLAGVQTLLVKPLTYMNLSGEAVAPIVGYANATPADLIVVHDDIDMPLGRLRVRKGGSCGGHNGVRNIIERLGTSDFVRIKIGVGKDRADVTGHVLGKFPPDARKVAEAAEAAAAKAAASVVSEGVEKAMNAWNCWRCDGAEGR